MSRAPVLALVTLFAGYCGLAHVLPPAEDEYYYWCWQEHGLQWSYYDHPLMTALLIKGSVAAFGDTLFAIRLPACVAVAFTLATVWHLTRPRTLVPLVAFTPLFTIGAVLITPDTPLLLFWSAYLLWLVKTHEQMDAGSVSWRMWIIGALLLGGGVLGKYTMALAGVAGFLSFAVAGGWRRWFAGWVAHGFLAVLVASPILIHNIRHDFAPLKYQWEHSMGAKTPGIKPFGDFVGVQVLLFGTLPLVLLPWVVARFRTLTTDPRLRVCACLYGFPFAFFLYKATRGPLEGNWALASYIAFWPLAAAWYDGVRHIRFWKWAGPASFGIPAVAVLAATVHLVHPIPWLSPRADRITRQAVKEQVAEQIREKIAERGERLPVYCGSYQMTALLRFHGIDARQIDGATRPSHFTQSPEKLTDVPRAYVVWDREPNTIPAAGCERIEDVAAFPITVRGQTLAYYSLMLYRRTESPPGGS